MAVDMMQPMDLQPKDILKFVEKRAERAIEVLREIIDTSEYATEGAIGRAVNPFQNQQASTNTAWLSTNAGSLLMNTMQAQQTEPLQGGFNG